MKAIAGDEGKGKWSRDVIVYFALSFKMTFDLLQELIYIFILCAKPVEVVLQRH